MTQRRSAAGEISHDDAPRVTGRPRLDRQRQSVHAVTTTRRRLRRSASADGAVQISPCVATRPVPPGSIDVSASPSSSDHARRAGHRPAAAGPRRPAARGTATIADERRATTGRISRRPDLQLRQRRVDQHHRAEQQADDPADARAGRSSSP